jgi:hydroxyacid-oxoacid transhydrogenase
MERDSAFELAVASIRFGAGTTREVGMELADRGVKRVMVVTDPHLCQMPPVQAVIEALEQENVKYVLYDRVSVEPTDRSFIEAIVFAQEGAFDGFVAVGGGSSMDTAKVADLYSTYPADLLAYVNAPVGEGRPVPGPLKPLVAIPTTAGTGSETTGVAIFDLVERHVKTGISHRLLKPTLGIVDPENTRTLPPAVAASTGLDVLTHALESYTAIPFDSRPRPERPKLRPTYCGANPISDLWALEALRLVAAYLPRAVADPGDDEARAQMCLAATIAGIGFGNAGVHLPHAMAYPVAGMVRDFRPEGYPGEGALVPHGIAVVVNAPTVFRYTGKVDPARHLRGAEALEVDISGASREDAGRVLADRIVALMRLLGMPNGLGAMGFGSEQIPALVEGTLAQQRLTQLAPIAVEEEVLAELFEGAMRYW